jgi:hypothetical protein
MPRLSARDATPTSLTLADYMDWQALRGSSLRHRRDIKRELLRFLAFLPEDILIDQVTRELCPAVRWPLSKSVIPWSEEQAAATLPPGGSIIRHSRST